MSILPLSGSGPQPLSSQGSDLKTTDVQSVDRAGPPPPGARGGAGPADGAQSATQNQPTQAVPAPEASGGTLATPPSRANAESVVSAQFEPAEAIAKSADRPDPSVDAAAKAYVEVAAMAKDDRPPPPPPPEEATVMVAEVSPNTDPFAGAGPDKLDMAA